MTTLQSKSTRDYLDRVLARQPEKCQYNDVVQCKCFDDYLIPLDSLCTFQLVSGSPFHSTTPQHRNPQPYLQPLRMCKLKREVWRECGHIRFTSIPCPAYGEEEGGHCCFGGKGRCETEQRTTEYPGFCLRCACDMQTAEMGAQEVPEVRRDEPANAGLRRPPSPRPAAAPWPRPAGGGGNRDSYIEPWLYAEGMNLMPSGDFGRFMPPPRQALGPRPADVSQLRARPARVGVPRAVGINSCILETEERPISISSSSSTGTAHTRSVSPIGRGRFDSPQSPQSVLFQEVETLWEEAGSRGEGPRRGAE